MAPLRIIAWDIGTINLSYCILEMVYYPINKLNYKTNKSEDDFYPICQPPYKIIDWGLINLVEKDQKPQQYCVEFKKNGEKCEKRAKFRYKKIVVCGTHSHKYNKNKLKKISQKKRKKIKSFKKHEI